MYRTHETDKIHHVPYPYQQICAIIDGYQNGNNAEELPFQFVSALVLEKWADDNEENPYEILAVLTFSYSFVYTEKFRTYLAYLCRVHMNKSDPPFAFSFDQKRGMVTVYHTTFII